VDIKRHMLILFYLSPCCWVEERNEVLKNNNNNFKQRVFKTRVKWLSFQMILLIPELSMNVTI
jgi:hypothetical protein